MKYYGIRKNRKKNDLFLKAFKLISKLDYLTEFDKEKKILEKKCIGRSF